MYRVELKAGWTPNKANVLSVFLMYRVELKGIYPVVNIPHIRFRFLMYRVELKVFILVGIFTVLRVFLMYRVELKENLVYN
jgi:hypothetical protein